MTAGPFKLPLASLDLGDSLFFWGRTWIVTATEAKGRWHRIEATPIKILKDDSPHILEGLPNDTLTVDGYKPCFPSGCPAPLAK